MAKNRSRGWIFFFIEKYSTSELTCHTQQSLRCRKESLLSNPRNAKSSQLSLRLCNAWKPGDLWWSDDPPPQFDQKNDLYRNEGRGLQM